MASVFIFKRRGAICSQLGVARESAMATRIWQTQIGKKWKSLMVKKMEGFRYALIRSWWHGKALGRLTRSGAS